MKRLMTDPQSPKLLSVLEDEIVEKDDYQLKFSTAEAEIHGDAMALIPPSDEEHVFGNEYFIG